MCFKSVKYLDRSVTMCLLLWFCLLWSCSDKVPQKEEDKNILQVMSEDNIEDFDKYYKPAEFEGMDMLRSDAKWSWFRSKQSEHFFVFWEAGFGDDPNAETVPANLRVDIDDLLEKAELFYRTNVEKLKFAETGQGKSFLDRYKMEIYLLYHTSIEPPKRLSNTLQSKPTLNSVDFSQRRSGFGLELTDKPGNHLPSL